MECPRECEIGCQRSKSRSTRQPLWASLLWVHSLIWIRKSLPTEYFPKRIFHGFGRNTTQLMKDQM